MTNALPGIRAGLAMQGRWRGRRLGARTEGCLALTQQNVVGLLELLKRNAGLLGRQLCGVGMQGLGLASKGLAQGFSVNPGAHAKPLVMAGAGF